MSLHYDFYETPVPKGSDRKKSLHARVVPSGTVTTDQLVRAIQRESSLSISDVKGALISLVENMKFEMADGWNIHLEGLGYFSLTLSSPPVRTPNEIRAESVKIKSVAFRPEKKLRDHFAGIQPEKAVDKYHSAKRSEEDIDTLLNKYFEENPYMKAKDFGLICGLRPSTATRKLKQLLTEGKLRKVYVYGHPLYESTNVK
jgi:predicted histone-like DNA-binding protein